MLELFVWVLNIIWKILIITSIFMLAKALLRHGKGTIREIFDTIALWISITMSKIRNRLIAKVRTEEVQKNES